VPRALYEYFWPERVAAYIRPPLAIVNMAIPFTYPPVVVALFSVPLALAVVPVVPTDAPVAVAEEIGAFTRLFEDREGIVIVVSVCYAQSGKQYEYKAGDAG